MEVYTITSNKYDHLIPNFALFFNKYWGNDQKVIVLAYREIKHKLPPNFEVIVIGEESKLWTNSLVTYFTNCKNGYFTILLDDYWLCSHVDQDYLSIIKSYIKRTDIDKIELRFPDKNQLQNYTNYNDMFLQLKQTADYRTSLQGAVWKRDYLLKYLVPNQSAWKFEIEGGNKAKGDGAIILAPTKKIFDNSNIYLKGKINTISIMKMKTKEDQKIISDFRRTYGDNV